ncbi:hypothetical protein B0H66DRAFT_60498 [Apodospora peruviana]|uniref:Uncharacterized protein n=1 Tax=Apodospora peruviana TaxID=516989 RepID=A0AAE0ISS4_9PEZI|nr:hypothetical protein B0H66DRAFT_60498 [Apodospora peruviana]
MRGNTVGFLHGAKTSTRGAETRKSSDCFWSICILIYLFNLSCTITPICSACLFLLSRQHHVPKRAPRQHMTKGAYALKFSMAEGGEDSSSDPFLRHILPTYYRLFLFSSFSTLVVIVYSRRSSRFEPSMLWKSNCFSSMFFVTCYYLFYASSFLGVYEEGARVVLKTPKLGRVRKRSTANLLGGGGWTL